MAGNTTQIIVDLIAHDKASKTLAKSAITIGAIGAAALKFGKDSVRAYSESEDAVNKLTFAHQKFPKVADVSVQSLDDLSQALQRKTVFDDEATKSAEATLAQFNLTGKQIEKLIPLVQDYAAFTGQDLQSATISVGKAFEGNAKALKAIGINFHATGNTAKDFATIQDDLNKKVGGFAENQGKTAAGQAQILANQFNDLQEQVGSLLVPALTDLVGVVEPLVQGFNDLPKPVKDVAVGAAAVAAVSLIVLPRLILIKDALEEIFGAGQEAAVGLGETAAAEKSIGTGAVGAAGKVDKLVTAVGRTAGLSLLVFALSRAFSDTADNAAAADAGVAAFGGNDTTAKLKAITQQMQSFPDVFSRTWKNSFQSITHSSDVLDKLGVSAADINSHLNDGDAAWSKYRQGLLDASDAAHFNGSTTGLLADNLDRARESSKKAADGQKILGAETATTTGKVEDQTHAYDDLMNKLLDYVNRLDSAKRAGIAKRKADRDAIQTIKDMGKDHKQTAAEVDDAFTSILDAANASAAAVQGAGNKNKAYRDDIVKLRSHVAKGSPLYKALTDYISKLRAIPTAIATKVALDFAVRGYAKAVAAGQSAHNAASAAIHGYAEGGWVAGPKGSPQLAVVHGGEYVVSDDMLAGKAPAAAPAKGMQAGGDTYVIQLPSGPYLATKREVTAWITDALQSSGRRGTSTTVRIG